MQVLKKLQGLEYCERRLWSVWEFIKPVFYTRKLSHPTLTTKDNMEFAWKLQVPLICKNNGQGVW